MASSTREIRRRVKAVKNIRQITRAMELVSAAKMQRAVTAVQQSRRYAELAWETLNAVTQKFDVRHHPLLARRPLRRLLVVLITSNRGLAGGFNSKIEDATRRYVINQQQITPGLVVDFVSVGKKGREYLLKFGYTIVADFTFGDRMSRVEEVLPLARLALDDYKREKYDAVAVAYSDFVSLLIQEPRIKEVLPLPTALLTLDDNGDESETSGESHYLYEPSPTSVFEALIPRLLETQLYQALVESRASEQAARMVAMRNATESAGDLIDDLTLTYNQLRQSGITQELAEISAGRLALGV